MHSEQMNKGAAEVKAAGDDEEEVCIVENVKRQMDPHSPYGLFLHTAGRPGYERKVSACVCMA